MYCKMKTIEGQIIDRLTRKPVSEARIILEHDSESHHDIAQISGLSGQFIFNDLYYDNYTIIVFSDNHKPFTKNINLNFSVNDVILELDMV